MCTQVIAEAEASIDASSAKRSQAAESAAASHERVDALHGDEGRLQHALQDAQTAQRDLLKPPAPVTKAQRAQQQQGWRAVEALHASLDKVEEELAVAQRVSQCSSQGSGLPHAMSTELVVALPACLQTPTVAYSPAFTASRSWSRPTAP